MTKSKRAGIFTSEMQFKNHLESIKATIVHHISNEELAKFIPDFVSITWLEDPSQIDLFMAERGLTREGIVNEMFARRTLPTAMECVQVVFLLEGLDLTNVTHVIRHRLFSYSAQSSDPTSMEGHDILENDAFMEHPDLLARARQLCIDANELYKDALDRGMTYYDARHYQPRAKEAKYYMKGDIAQFISFINTRLGRQNQPTSDNILALRMRQALLKVYPQIEPFMPTQAIQYAYINAIDKKFNLNTYPPDHLHRMALTKTHIDYSDVDFAHDLPREDYSCNDHFEELFNRILMEK